MFRRSKVRKKDPVQPTSVKDEARGSFFDQASGQRSDQGEKKDTSDAQEKRVIAVTRCSPSAVLGLFAKGTPLEVTDKIRAAEGYALSKVEKSSQPFLRESLSTGVVHLPEDCNPTYVTIKPRNNETEEQQTAREDKQEDRNYEEEMRATKSRQEYNAQALLAYQTFRSLLTSDAEQAMKDQGAKWAAMELAKDVDRVLKFIKLYKEVAIPPETKTGVTTIHAMTLLKRAMETNQDKLGVKSISRLGEEVTQRMEAVSGAGVYISIAPVEEAYLKKKKLTVDEPTSSEGQAGYTRASAADLEAMREQLQKETGGLVFMTSLSKHGPAGSFYDAINNEANLTGTNAVEGKTITQLVGMASRHSGDKRKPPKPKKPHDDASDDEKQEADFFKLAFTTTGKESDKGDNGPTCLQRDDVDRLAPDKKNRLWFDRQGKPFKCMNQACIDAKKNLGHSFKLCPNKEPKKDDKEEDATTGSGLALATVNTSNQAVIRTLFGDAAISNKTNTGFGLTTAGSTNDPIPASSAAWKFGGGKAGVGTAPLTLTRTYLCVGRVFITARLQTRALGRPQFLPHGV